MSKLYLELVIIKDTISRIKTQGNNWGKLFTKYTVVQNLAKISTDQPCNVKPRGKKNKRQFTEESWMIHKQIKRSLNISLIKEKQNIITVKYHLTSHKPGKQRNSWQQPVLGNTWGKESTLRMLVRVEMRPPLWEPVSTPPPCLTTLWCVK